MTKQSTEALIAESREVARQYDPAFRFVLTRVIDRLEAVAKDSSTGQQMHAYWQQRAEELTAVVEKVREQVEHTMHPERYKARCGVCRIESTLATAPTDVLREHDAKVRAEAIRSARNEIMPPVNCELRPDGTEDPEAAEYVAAMNEVHDRLGRIADRIEREEQD